jgi:plasmid stabilization system protein ParE
VAAVRHASGQIAKSLRSGGLYLAGMRYRQVRGFPYLIVYRHSAKRVEIVAVAHGSREPGYWLDRIQ